MKPTLDLTYKGRVKKNKIKYGFIRIWMGGWVRMGTISIQKQTRTTIVVSNGRSTFYQIHFIKHHILLDVAWERGGGWISPHLLDHLKTLRKTKKKFFDFLKVHNELGKVTKFWTSRPLFSWRNSHLKKVQAPPCPNKVNNLVKKGCDWILF